MREREGGGERQRESNKMPPQPPPPHPPPLSVDSINTQKTCTFAHVQLTDIHTLTHTHTHTNTHTHTHKTHIKAYTDRESRREGATAPHSPVPCCTRHAHLHTHAPLTTTHPPLYAPCLPPPPTHTARPPTHTNHASRSPVNCTSTHGGGSGRSGERGGERGSQERGAERR